VAALLLEPAHHTEHQPNTGTSTCAWASVRLEGRHGLHLSPLDGVVGSAPAAGPTRTKVSMPFSPSYLFLSRAASLQFTLVISNLLAVVALSSVRELHVYIGLQLGRCSVISTTGTIKFVVMVSLLLDFSAGTAILCLLCYCYA
jgi:hypothetical protein